MAESLKSKIESYVRENWLVVIYSLLGAATVAHIIHQKRISNNDYELLHNSLIYGFCFGLPICWGKVYLIREFPQLNKPYPLILGLVASLGFILSYNYNSHETFLAHIITVAYLLFIISPKVIRRDEKVGFHWIIYTLFAVGASITITLVFAGLLSFLVWVIKELFNYEIPKILQEVGLGLLWVFLPVNLFSFLKTSPEKISTLRYQMPVLLEKPVTLLFVPLMFIYIGVLLVYALKILVEFELPQGMVSAPISVAYVLFFLLNAYLESQDREMRGLWKYNNRFQLLFIPLFIMMGIGITVRISDYGITDDRVYLVLAYIVMLFSFFLRLFTKRLELRLLVAFTGTILLITSIGPLSPSSLEKHSQVRQFLKIASKYGSKFEKPEDFQFAKWKLPDVRSARSALGVIERNDAYSHLNEQGLRTGLFVNSSAGEFAKINWGEVERVLATLDPGRHSYEKTKNSGDDRLCKKFHTNYKSVDRPIDVSGYDWYVKFVENSSSRVSATSELKSEKVTFEIDYKTMTLLLRRDRETTEEILNIGEQIRAFASVEEKDARTEPVAVSVAHKKYRLKLLVWNAQIDCFDSEVKADLLIKVLPN